GFGHMVGALRQPIERRCRLVAILLARFASRDSLGAQLRHITQRLFEIGPVLGLVGRHLEAGLEPAMRASTTAARSSRLSECRCSKRGLPRSDPAECCWA